MNAQLTPTAQALLATLQWRDGLGQAYVIPEPGKRVGLVAPTLRGRYPARVDGWDRADMQALAAAGLVDLAHSESRPYFTFATVAPLPGTSCERITLTDSGRAHDTGTGR